MRILHTLFVCCAITAASAQSVGDFSIPYKSASTGPQTVKTWSKVNSTLWGTDPDGNPHSIALAGGLTLSGNTLNGPDLSTYQPLIADGGLSLVKLATDPLARANHTGTQDVATLTGTLPIDQGGTGQTTVSGARGALLPSKTGNAGKVLTVSDDETDYELATPAGGASGLPRSYLAGFGLVYANGTSMGISPGVCRDDTDTYDIVLASSLNAKAPSTAWAAGDLSGCSDGSGWNAGTNYAVFAILNPTTGVVNVLTSTSATSPTLPAGFTVKRRIGWVRTLAASANMTPWTQFGDLFIMNPTTTEYSGSITTTSTPITLAAPPNVLVTLNVNAVSTAVWNLRIDSTYSFTSVAISGFSCCSGAANATDASQVHVFTDSSSQIYARSLSAATITTSLSCHAWRDTRGRDD